MGIRFFFFIDPKSYRKIPYVKLVRSAAFILSSAQKEQYTRKTEYAINLVHRNRSILSDSHITE